MRPTSIAPGLDVLGELVQVVSTERRIFSAEIGNRSVQGSHLLTHSLPGLDRVVDTAAEEDESIGQPGGPVERLLAGTAQPDWDRLGRFREERGPINTVKLAGEVGDRLGEQPPEQRNLLLLPCA